MHALVTILRSVRPLWPFYLVITLMAVTSAGLEIASPFVVKQATDAIVASLTGAVSTDSAMHTVLIMAGVFFVIQVLGTLVRNIGGYIGDVMAARMKAMLSSRYYAKLLSLPQRWFDDQVTGTIIARLDRSIANVTTFMQTGSNNMLPMILTVIAVLVITTQYSWVIALALIILAPINVILTGLTSKHWQRVEQLKNGQIDMANGRFAEVVGQPKVVKSFVGEWRELRVFGERYRRVVNLTKRQSVHWHWMDVGRSFVADVVFAVIYLVILVNTMRGVFSVGDLVMLVQLVYMVRMPILSMSWIVDHAQRAVAGSRDYFAIMDLPLPEQVPSALAEASVSATLPSAWDREIDVDVPMPIAGSDAVVFDHISFSYADGEEVLHDISFSIPAGKRVALVSESGGGKSTLINLLLGLYTPQSGQLFINGHNIAALTSMQVRAQVGVVFQDSQLFSGTVAENIAYGRPLAPPEAIEEAAKRANAHSFIAEFSRGYATLIGERGLRLSGGQQQRVSVARAMLKDAPILVLDEATSALDTKAEIAVQAGLEELMAGRTTIVIAHRLSTIATVDTIVTLRSGRIDEIGTPAELAVSGGIYSELLALTQTVNDQNKERLKAFGFEG